MSQPSRRTGTAADPNGLLVKAAEAARRDRADQLYRRFGAVVYRRSLVLLGSPEVATRATQQVFILLLRRPERFDHPQALRWIQSRTTRHCLAALRRTAAEPDRSRQPARRPAIELGRSLPW